MKTIRAARVGATRDVSREEYACERCGARKTWKPGRGRLCRDCIDVLALERRRSS